MCVGVCIGGGGGVAVRGGGGGVVHVLYRPSKHRDFIVYPGSKFPQPNICSLKKDWMRFSVEIRE